MKKGLFTRIRKSKFNGKNYVGNFSQVHNCEMGYGTYCGSSCKLINMKFGKFCSIASNVKVLFGEHPTSGWISTFPGFYSPHSSNDLSFVREEKFEEYKYYDKKEKIFVEIGNDVWIASDVKLVSGISIGDGAVIAAGAVVTSNVEPYKIVGGIPAREIGQRFSDEEIDFLLQNKWWEKEIEWIRDNANSFSDIEKYKKACKKR